MRVFKFFIALGVNLILIILVIGMAAGIYLGGKTLTATVAAMREGEKLSEEGYKEAQKSYENLKITQKATGMASEIMAITDEMTKIRDEQSIPTAEKTLELLRTTHALSVSSYQESLALESLGNEQMSMLAEQDTLTKAIFEITKKSEALLMHSKENLNKTFEMTKRMAGE